MARTEDDNWAAWKLTYLHPTVTPQPTPQDPGGTDD